MPEDLAEALREGDRRPVEVAEPRHQRGDHRQADRGRRLRHRRGLRVRPVRPGARRAGPARADRPRADPEPGEPLPGGRRARPTTRATRSPCPYAWGTTGLCYREDLTGYDADAAGTTCSSPTPSVEGKITMMATERWLALPAQKALGYSVNTTDDAELAARCKDLLVEPEGPTCSAYDDTTFYERLISGEAVDGRGLGRLVQLRHRREPRHQVRGARRGQRPLGRHDGRSSKSLGEQGGGARLHQLSSSTPTNHAWVAENILYKVPEQGGHGAGRPASLTDAYPNLGDDARPSSLEGESLVDLGEDAPMYTDIATEVTRQLTSVTVDAPADRAPGARRLVRRALLGRSCGPGLLFTVVFMAVPLRARRSATPSSRAAGSAASSTSSPSTTSPARSSRSTCKVLVNSLSIAGAHDGARAAARLPDGVRHRPAAAARWRTVALVLVVLPFWTNFLIRTYAWIVLLNTEGIGQPDALVGARGRRRAARRCSTPAARSSSGCCTPTCR